MKNKAPIQAADLYVLLQRELRRRQPAQCTTCFMQLPFRVDRGGGEGPNWEVVLPPQCPQGCKEVMEEIVYEYGLVYELAPEARAS
jgi:hypothetical protein